jgi:hypothetical protein
MRANAREPLTVEAVATATDVLFVRCSWHFADGGAAPDPPGGGAHGACRRADTQSLPLTASPIPAASLGCSKNWLGTI